MSMLSKKVGLVGYSASSSQHGKVEENLFFSSWPSLSCASLLYYPLSNQYWHYSTNANNILNTYSTALSIQALGRPFAMIPRFFWTLFCFVIYTIAGVAGHENLFSNLSSFLSILSYWTGFFIIIVTEEHFIFWRKGGKLGGYNLDDWDSPSKWIWCVYMVLCELIIICRLPCGIVGILAGCFGVVGVILGMFSVGYFGILGYFAGFDLGFEVWI